MKTWLTVSEGAEYAGVSRDTIYTACERRELHHARIGGRRSIRLKPEWSTRGWNGMREARRQGRASSRARCAVYRDWQKGENDMGLYA
jgi:excisionase family DNA binding protein